MTEQALHSVREDYDRFIDEAIATEIIWGLSHEDGWASCESHDFEGRSVIPFWSDEKNAAAACCDDWQDYKPTPLRMDEFIDDWLHGMHEDEVLAGINWNRELVGVEIEPLMLIEDLLEGE
ncbi:DUF2750 domain-containing protein [Aliikangiella coralliicola]|uniref:DUF2750 domain-containing protein n=1 Tax=Aliikangiella coralliicola TaxID=2592383 RepID=A0A545UD39_9GAMM|nr:DUF2750 domain-containing protein [Aliikangiella coralliicola]TQV87384.1 DUF2750 domain-containing protein [Aliikangiella coralliicola]